MIGLKSKLSKSTFIEHLTVEQEEEMFNIITETVEGLKKRIGKGDGSPRTVFKESVIEWINDFFEGVR